jgi:hypothetical protein
MFHISNINTLTSIYFPYFHSILKYGIIFQTEKRCLLYKTKLLKLLIWLVKNLEYHIELCLKRLEILHSPYQYIFWLMNFIVKNHLHGPNDYLSCFQKGILCADIRIFNSLPLSLTNIKNEKARYLNTHSIYSVDEFFYLSGWSIILHMKSLWYFYCNNSVCLAYFVYLVCLWLIPYSTCHCTNL